MFCPACGTQLEILGAFCPACGRDLQDLKELVESEPPRWGEDLAVPWRGGQVALGIALVGIGFLLVTAATVVTRLLGAGLAWEAWLGSHAIGLIILVTVWLLGQHQGNISLQLLGLRRPRVSWVSALLLAALALGLSLGFTALYAWVMQQLGTDLLVPPDVPSAIVFDGFAAVLTFEALAVWTPLTEEIFFRGFVLTGLMARWGITKASIGSALVFSLFHLHPGVLLPILFTGLLLAALYQATGSLWPPVIAHAGQNTIALFVIIYGG